MFMHKHGNKYKAWIVPVPLCALYCTKNARYYRGDITVVTDRLDKPSENYVQFFQRDLHRS